MKDLKEFIGFEYANLSEDGKLTYYILQQKGEYARFLDEVVQKVDIGNAVVRNEIRSLVEEIYKLSYSGLVNSVKESQNINELSAALYSVRASTPEVVQRAVENPISGLTLSDTLQKNRQQVIYNIKQQIGIGLTQGDTIRTMANRISEVLDKDYRKAIRIARTEVHRVREAGFNDSATEIDNVLQNGSTGIRLIKLWKTMKDERVRDGEADHVRMEGQAVLADEKFTLSNGAKTVAPGQSGYANQDINCRCYVSYQLIHEKEYKKSK